MAEEERERKWAVLRLRGLRKRWIINTILPVLVLLVLLVTLVSAGVSTFYYSSMQDGLYQQVEAMSSSFNDYFMNSYAEYNQMAAQAVDTYEDKECVPAGSNALSCCRYCFAFRLPGNAGGKRGGKPGGGPE